MPLNNAAKTALAIGACATCWKLLEEKSQSVVQELLVAVICIGCGAQATVSAIEHGDHARKLIAARRVDQVQQAPAQEPRELRRPQGENHLQNRDLRGGRAGARAPGRGVAFASTEFKNRERIRNSSRGGFGRSAGLAKMYESM